MSYLMVGRQYLNEVARYFARYFEDRQARLALMLVLTVAVGVGSYRWYRNRVNGLQSRAISAFGDAVKVYEKAQTLDFDWFKKDQKPLWDEAEFAFNSAYKENSSSEFAPYFLIYEARSLAAQKKYAAALELLRQGISKLGKGSLFFDLYQILEALISIDAQDEGGVERLQALALDQNNSYQDMARYHLAQYYLSQDRWNDAQDLLTSLVAEAKAEEHQSTWSSLAQAYLN